MTKKSIVVLPETNRGRGRPFSGGRDLLFSFRMPEKMREAVSRYAEYAELSRSAAARIGVLDTCKLCRIDNRREAC